MIKSFDTSKSSVKLRKRDEKAMNKLPWNAYQISKKCVPGTRGTFSKDGGMDVVKSCLKDLQPDEATTIDINPLGEFINEIVTDLDPEQGVEEEFRKLNSDLYTWKFFRSVAINDLDKMDQGTFKNKPTKMHPILVIQNFMKDGNNKYDLKGFEKFIPKEEEKPKEEPAVDEEMKPTEEKAPIEENKETPEKPKTPEKKEEEKEEKVEQTEKPEEPKSEEKKPEESKPEEKKSEEKKENPQKPAKPAKIPESEKPKTEKVDEKEEPKKEEIKKPAKPAKPVRTNSLDRKENRNPPTSKSQPKHNSKSSDLRGNRNNNSR